MNTGERCDPNKEKNSRKMPQRALVLWTIDCLYIDKETIVLMLLCMKICRSDFLFYYLRRKKKVFVFALLPRTERNSSIFSLSLKRLTMRSN